MSSYPDFPADLPRPLLAGYGFQPSADVVAEDVEVGLPNLRRDSSLTYSSGKVTWRMSSTQWQSLVRFWDETLNAVGWFYMQIDTGGGLARHKVRFVDGQLPKPAQDGPKMLVSAILETDQLNYPEI